LGFGGALLGIGAVTVTGVAAWVMGLDQLRRGHLSLPVMRRVTTSLNVFSVVLLAVVSLPAFSTFGSWMADAPDRPIQAANDGSRPDIYLILLDGYARSDELQRQFGIDNSSFLGGLGERGFDVDSQSRTNYTYTALTLTSLLSMDYLKLDSSGVVAEADLLGRLHDAMVDSPAFDELRATGYEILATDPGWEHVVLRSGVDRYLDRPELSDFEMALLRRTWLADLPPVPRDLFFDQLRSRITGVLTDAASVASEVRSAPTFTFVHVPSPHLPLAFGRNGEATPYSSRQYRAGNPEEFGLSEAGYRSAYAANLAYLSDRVLETLDAILATSDIPPVIVIMSDHGYTGDSPVHGESMLHSLFAAYTPQHPELLKPSPTPVNLLRVLLGAYTDADLGDPLPQRFFSVSFTGNTGAYTLALTEVEDP
jgi:hypothetical protein